MFVPVGIIVDGVIDTALCLAAHAFVHAGDAEIIEERDVIRSCSQSAYREGVFVRARRTILVTVIGGVMKRGICQIGGRAGLFDDSGYLFDELFECMRTADAQPTFGRGIGIQISNAFLFQFILVFFGPFG